ncbi:MAG: MG2 domain-containing protein [Thermoanaerobaculia bacterium]
MRRILALVALALLPISAEAAGLTILKATPNGEIAKLEEAREISVIFSEPMVALGKIPKNVAPPWFVVDPKIEGSFRWSGTDTLIFTPAHALPFATRYTVAIGTGAESLRGTTLSSPYSFSFTTPSVRLLDTRWYREPGRPDAPIYVALRFNQAVDPHRLLSHLSFQLVPHAFKPPAMSATAIARLRKDDPQALALYEAKAAAVKTSASSASPVLVWVPDSWNLELLGKPSPDLVVVATRPGIPPGSTLQVRIDGKVPSPAGPVTPGVQQLYKITLPPPLFVEGFRCTKQCVSDSWNPLTLTRPVSLASLRAALTIDDITDPAKPLRVEQHPSDDPGQDVSSSFGFSDLGYSIEPAHTYAVRISRSLLADNGEALGYDWLGIVEYWHDPAYSSFGDGHGVWESSAGRVIPFYARNLVEVKQWEMRVDPSELMPTIVRFETAGYQQPPPVPPTERRLKVTSDQIQSYGMDLSPALGGSSTGVAWVAVQDQKAIPRSSFYATNPEPRATLVQVTNLGITVKDSPVNTLIFVTRLDDGSPVEGATVRMITPDNRTVWEGITAADGVAMGPRTPRDDDWWKFAFIVTASKGGDLAYVSSDWNEGVQPWDFGVEFNSEESRPLIRGSVFSDRGVYKPGEEVHLKAVLRKDELTGMQLFPAGTEVSIAVTDSQNGPVDARTVKLSDWSSADWTFRIPDTARLGSYAVTARTGEMKNAVTGSFLVAAYRRPEFRVDVNVSTENPITGMALNGRVESRYLFGAPMSARPLTWRYTKDRVWSVPAEIENRFPEGSWEFLGRDPGSEEWIDGTIELGSGEAVLDANGVWTTTIQTSDDEGLPWRYQLEAEVGDVSRQKIANRGAVVVHPAPWYVGLESLPFFVDATKGADTEVVAANLDGTTASGVTVDLTLTRIQWHSVRRAEGNGFYTWDWEREAVPSGEWKVTTRAEPVPLHIPLDEGGYYVLKATARDGDGRFTRTYTSFYGIGAGYTAWQRYDHNRIDLVPERTHYKPGEHARIMIKSPWETATALLTTEREGVRTHREFTLTSTQQTVEIPVTEADIPNVFVSVLLVKGRTREAADESGNDPGKPAFRLGYTELTVDDASKRLDVDVKANRDEYRPATKAGIDVTVKDASGKPAAAEVTLWAVDYGVLSLTAYRTPDILESVWVPKSLQVFNEDSRQKIISRRVLTPKGADEGGGGGQDGGPGMVRKDFRVLAFWVGSVITDRRGRARTTITLPESLTTYRIMAVAADKASRFGRGESEIRINKPVLLTSTWPRFLNVGDKAHFGAVVHSQLKRAGDATVTIRSLDPSILDFPAETTRRVHVDANGSAEVRFDAVARAVGRARMQMSVRMGRESDAFEDSIPVEIPVSPETVAAYGQTKEKAVEQLSAPKDVIPSFGGLHVELSSTALVGLGEGARYLVEYPYGCAEQRSSRTLGLILASDLGEAFRLPGIEPDQLKVTAQQSLRELETFQCDDGGFAYWKGECRFESPFLTSYIVHVYQRAGTLGYTVDQAALGRAYDYLERQLSASAPEDPAWRPSWLAWQAYAVKVLTAGGRNEESAINRLWASLDRMPVFALAYLHDAISTKGGSSRASELRRRMTNAILPEGGTAHVEELNDPYLLLFWNSNVRSTAVVLRSLVESDQDAELAPRMVRWLLSERKKGRWSNTQENALVMEALVDYYKRYESEVPDFQASVSLGQTPLVSDSFEGRSTESKSDDVPMSKLLAATDEAAQPLVFSKSGTGTLFYAARLRYASSDPHLDALDQGIRVERHYTLLKGDGKDVTSVAAGDLLRVTLRLTLSKERRWVAVTDPIPAGFEPVETMFATTATTLVEAQQQSNEGDWLDWWKRGGFDHVERHDDRVDVFATRLSEGVHEYTYVLRATTAGTFITGPTHAEEMYEPEVFGRTASVVVGVSK